MLLILRFFLGVFECTCWSCHSKYFCISSFGTALEEYVKISFLLYGLEMFSLFPFSVYIIFIRPQFAPHRTSPSHLAVCLHVGSTVQDSSEWAFACDAFELEVPRERDYTINWYVKLFIEHSRKWTNFEILMSDLILELIALSPFSLPFLPPIFFSYCDLQNMFCKYIFYHVILHNNINKIEISYMK